MNKETYFQRALDEIAQMHSLKSTDYTNSGEFSNFIESAQAAQIETYQAIETLIGTKEARIRTIRQNEKRGVLVANEPLIDSYLDRAVYAIISYAYILMLNDAVKSVENLNDRNR